MKGFFNGGYLILLEVIYMEIRKVLGLVLISLTLVGSSYSMERENSKDPRIKRIAQRYVSTVEKCSEESFAEEVNASLLNKTIGLLSKAFSVASHSIKNLGNNKKRLAGISGKLNNKIVSVLSDDDALQDFFNSDNYDDLARKAFEDTLCDSIYEEAQPSGCKTSCCKIAKGSFFLASSLFWYFMISGLFYPETRDACLWILKRCGPPLGLVQLGVFLGKWRPTWMKPLAGVKMICSGLKGLVGKNKKEAYID